MDILCPKGLSTLALKRLTMRFYNAGLGIKMNIPDGIKNHGFGLNSVKIFALDKPTEHTLSG